MNLITTYLLNVALHAGVLSIFAALIVAFLRLPQQRSFVAIVGLLAVGFLPWITALRPVPASRTLPAIIEVHATPPPAELPLWTIVTVPAKNEVAEPLVPSVATTAEWKLPDFLTSLMALWAAGTGIGLVLFTLAWAKVMLWKKSLAYPDDITWQKLRSLVPYHLGKRDFLICPSDASPCVIGLWRTRIVIPRFLLDQPDENLGWAVRHEIGHRQAGDSRWMMLFTLIRCVNWWNPLVHRLITVWADAREQLCDLHAAPLADKRADYGEFLITMARNIGKQPPLAVAMAKRFHARRLKQRIISLLNSRTGDVKPLGKGFVGISSGTFVMVAVLVSVLKIKAEDMPVVSASSSGELISEPTAQAPSEDISPPSALPQPPVVDEADPSTPTEEKKGAAGHIKISTKFILTNFETGFVENVPDGGRFTILSVFSEGQMETIMRGFAGESGTLLKQSPSISAQPDQEAIMEIISEVLGTPEQIARIQPGARAPWVGIAEKMVARFSDTSPGIELKLHVEYRFIPGSAPFMGDTFGKPVRGYDPDKIKIVQKTVSGRLLSNYTVAVSLGEIEPGQYLTALTRAEILDVTGRPVDFQEIQKQALERESIIVNKRRADEGTVPLPEIPGKLRLSATFVDLPLNKPRPPGEGLVIGLTPSARSVADQIKKTPGGKVRELKTIDIPLNQRITPWPEFPGLSLTTLVSKNHQVISLTSHAIGTGENEFPNTWEQAPGDVMNFGIRTADKSVERRLLITIKGVR